MANSTKENAHTLMEKYTKASGEMVSPVAKASKLGQMAESTMVCGEMASLLEPVKRSILMAKPKKATGKKASSLKEVRSFHIDNYI